MQDEPVDHYERLQISPNADPDTIHRVYRLLAQRFHPDNKETGDAERFRLMCDAYEVLSDPQRRAQYDVVYQHQRQNRFRLVQAGGDTDDDMQMQRSMRLTILDALYTQRRLNAREPGLYAGELEDMLGAPTEHVEFSLWFLTQKKLVQKSDSSRITITADGVEYLELNYPNQRSRRLPASTIS